MRLKVRKVDINNDIKTLIKRCEHKHTYKHTHKQETNDKKDKMTRGSKGDVNTGSLKSHDMVANGRILKCMITKCLCPRLKNKNQKRKYSVSRSMTIVSFNENQE